MSAASSSVVEAQVALRTTVDVQPEFEALYRRYFGFAWASLRRLGVPPAAIDDAAQDLWVTVHRRLDSLDPEASVKAWLFGIARRVASHYRRSAQRNARKIAALAIGEERRSDQPMGRREIALTMETFLSRLDETKRIAFVLSELEGWSAPEIARVAGTNPNTIYSRIRLAKQEMRDHFAAADAEAYVEQAIEEVKVATRPPRGAAKHCWVGLVPKLGGGGAVTAATGIGGAIAKLKFVALGAVAGAVGLVGVDAALPEAPAKVHAAAPIEAREVSREAAKETARERAPKRESAPVVTATPVEPVLPATAAPVENVPVQRPSPTLRRDKTEERAAAIVVPEPAPAPPPTPSVDDGTAVLADATRALQKGDPARALELVREHARRFPGSRLGDVRDMTEVKALCASGRNDAARERAAEIVAKNPNSSAAKRVRDACKG